MLLLIYNVTLVSTIIMTIILLGVIVRGLLWMRKKDELQLKVIQKAMSSSSFLALMAITLAKAIFEVFILSGLIEIIAFKSSSIEFIISGLTLFILNFYLENRKFKVGNQNAE